MIWAPQAKKYSGGLWRQGGCPWRHAAGPWRQNPAHRAAERGGWQLKLDGFLNGVGTYNLEAH